MIQFQRDFFHLPPPLGQGRNKRGGELGVSVAGDGREVLRTVVSVSKFSHLRMAIHKSGTSMMADSNFLDNFGAQAC